MTPPKIVIMTVQGNEMAITEYSGDDSREAIGAYVEEKRAGGAGYAIAYRYTGSADSTGLPVYREMGGGDVRPIPVEAISSAERPAES